MGVMPRIGLEVFEVFLELAESPGDAPEARGRNAGIGRPDAMVSNF